MKPSNLQYSIPHEVLNVTSALKKAGFEAYLVGGCVRDLLLNKKPKDWDITTNATPEKIIALFPETFYENKFGTVGVVNKEAIDETLKIIEVTPYREEASYSDNRRPDFVTFSSKLEDDLKRRDFTINALALDPDKGHIIDLYNGITYLQEKCIKTVGNPDERFREDGLRILRAIRLHAELGFTINIDTEKAILENGHLLRNIARERVRDEFTRIIMSPNPMEALQLCKKLSIVKYIIPELEETYDIEQTQAHAFDVWNHLLKSLQHSADKNLPFHVRLSALLHDIGKPRTRRRSIEKDEWTFYGHDVISMRMAEKILKDLRFSKELNEKTLRLVRWHMFFSDTDAISLSAVRRLVSNVGKDNIWDLINLRMCDRIGTGRPKEDPYRLRKFKSMIEQVMSDPVSVGMLKVSGKDIMETTKLAPGPKIGFILHALLEEVLDDPKLNTKEYLTQKAQELSTLSVKELSKIGQKGKERRDDEQDRKTRSLRKKHHVD